MLSTNSEIMLLKDVLYPSFLLKGALLGFSGDLPEAPGSDGVIFEGIEKFQLLFFELLSIQVYPVFDHLPV